MSLSFLVHSAADNVGVAVRDIDSPGPVEGGFRHSDTTLGLDVREPIPLGHKVALADVAAGADIVEYGVVIGAATTDIARGAHVHTQNLKGKRWA